MTSEFLEGPARGGAIARVFEALPTRPVPWTVFEQALVVQAIEWGWITHDEALSRYLICPDELQRWQSTLR
jgi:hypothetical protein